MKSLSLNLKTDKTSFLSNFRIVVQDVSVNGFDCYANKWTLVKYNNYLYKHYLAKSSDPFQNVTINFA